MKDDIETREDECCAAKGDAFCGGGFMAEADREICSKQDADMTLHEFKCYPDEDEFPLPAVIGIVVVVGLGIICASIFRFRYMRFQATELPEDRALFTKRDSKVLTRSNTGSDSIANFARLSRSGSKSDYSQKSQGASSSLPNLFPQDGVNDTKGHKASDHQQEGTGQDSMDFVITFSTESDENDVTCI